MIGQNVLKTNESPLLIKSLALGFVLVYMNLELNLDQLGQ
jgi:hypothetical protein